MSGSNTGTSKALIVATEPKASAEAAGSSAPSSPSMDRGKRPIPAMFNARLVAVGAVGLALGTMLGVVTAPRDRSSEAVAALRAEIHETRSEIRSVSEASRRSEGAIATLREDLGEAKSGIDRREAAGSERLGNVEKALATGFADLQGRRDREEQELATRLGTIVASIDRLTPSSSATSKAKSDPDTTSAIVDAKPPIPDPGGEWALREVLDGVAVIENRKRRILEVSRGDVVPGLGRVEAVEKRSRTWVVVTKQGVVVPQGW